MLICYETKNLRLFYFHLYGGLPWVFCTAYFNFKILVIILWCMSYYSYIKYICNLLVFQEFQDFSTPIKYGVLASSYVSSTPLFLLILNLPTLRCFLFCTNLAKRLSVVWSPLHATCSTDKEQPWKSQCNLCINVFTIDNHYVCRSLTTEQTGMVVQVKENYNVWNSLFLNDRKWGTTIIYILKFRPN